MAAEYYTPQGSESQKVKRGCGFFFQKFDDQILRPIFIYKYGQRRHIKNEVSFDAILDEIQDNQDIISEVVYRSKSIK